MILGNDFPITDGLMQRIRFDLHPICEHGIGPKTKKVKNPKSVYNVLKQLADFQGKTERELKLVSCINGMLIAFQKKIALLMNTYK